MSVRSSLGAEGATGTFLLADGEIRVDRGDSHLLGRRRSGGGRRRARLGLPAPRRRRARLRRGNLGRARRGATERASARRQRRDREREDRATADRPERRAGRPGARRAVPARLRHAAARTARSQFSTAGWRPPGRTPSTRTRWGPVTRSQQRCWSGWPERTIWAGHCETAAALPERRSRTGTSARRRGSCPRPRLDLVPGRRYTSGDESRSQPPVCRRATPGRRGGRRRRRTLHLRRALRAYGAARRRTGAGGAAAGRPSGGRRPLPARVGAPLLGMPVARGDLRSALAAGLGCGPRLLPRGLGRGALPRGRRRPGGIARRGASRHAGRRATRTSR